MSEKTTITIDRSTKRKLDAIKPDDLTWDAFFKLHVIAPRLLPTNRVSNEDLAEKIEEIPTKTAAEIGSRLA